MEGITEPKLEVKVTSTQRVKPSSPTPSHLQTLTLSYVDQIIPLFPPFLTPGILFYPASPENQPLNIITTLKTSLSQTLTKFYPLAGRVEQSTITCTDEGIPFIEAQVNCPLSAVLYSAPNPEILSKLLPPPDSLGLVENPKKPISELIHMSIQISIFTCGGFSLAWYDIHKITDGISSANFFKYWVAMAAHGYGELNLINPNFDMGPTIFPPTPIAEPLLIGGEDNNPPQECTVVVKSFLFKDSALSKLKPKAESKKVPNPTRFLTISGFIWEQALASKSVPFDSKDDMTALTLNLDIRSRINPRLPVGSMGNLVTATVASAEVQARLPDLVAQIHDAVRKKKDEIRGYCGDDGVKAMRGNWKKLIRTYGEYKDRAYKITSWCNAGFSELDFGFGKPKWMVPTDGKLNCHFRNLIILNDNSDSIEGGIEAWLFLEEKEMENLVSNPEFLALASSVF